MMISTHVIRIGRLTVGCVTFAPRWWERLLGRTERERYATLVADINGGTAWIWDDDGKRRGTRVDDPAVIAQLDRAVRLGTAVEIGRQ